MAKEFKLCGHRPAYWETKCPECGADGPVVIWNGTEEAKKYWDDFVQKGLEEVKPSASDNNQMDAIAEQYINEVAFLDSSDTGVVRSFAAYLQQQHH